MSNDWGQFVELADYDLFLLEANLNDINIHTRTKPVITKNNKYLRVENKIPYNTIILTIIVVVIIILY